MDQVSIGAGPIGLLGVAFVVLKLTGVINWAWLWVLAPFWIPFTLGLVIVILMLVFALITGGKR